MNQTQSLLSRPIPSSSEKPSQMEKQIKKFRPQPQDSMFLNPYFGFLMPIPEASMEKPSSDKVEDTEPEVIAANLYSKPKETTQKENLWTEAFHIEFPSVVVCKQPSDSTTKTFSAVLKIYENAVTDFVNSHNDIDFLYINIMKWINLNKTKTGKIYSTVMIHLMPFLTIWI